MGGRICQENYGVNLVNKPFEEGNFQKGVFDVVTMWDVIEHFTDPVFEIEKVFEIIKPNGVLCFSTITLKVYWLKQWGSKWPWYMEMHKVF